MNWSHTLHLPKSQLANRSNAKLITQNLDRVTTQLYKWQKTQTERPLQILHDGPPYANGELHMGHALNKILKDIINRHAINSGYRIQYLPGWDCHGLPIEHTALKKAKRQGLSAVERRSLARKLALQMVENQKQGFMDFGIMGDWSDPNERYLTLSKDYVVRELRMFEKLMAKNLVYRRRMPVFWSAESGTALAESELVYGERESTAAYLAYPLVGILGEELKGINNLCLAVWTTTPWTLPANQAVAVNKEIKYAVVEYNKSYHLLVAENLLEHLKLMIPGIGSVVKSGILGASLVGLEYACPLRASASSKRYPVIAADHVTDSAGTGLVHTAPGHGKEDYIAGHEHKLHIVSPVDGRGKYTTDVSPPSLAGLDARKEGTPRVLELLESEGAILHTHKITHSVPHDWRTKTPVLVRATPQYFIDLGDEVRGLALQALDKVSFRPESGRQRLQAFTESRTSWCVSRQRPWGVPIPVIYHKETEEPVLTRESCTHIINQIETLGEQGVDAWFQQEEDIEQWLHPSLQKKGLGRYYYKGQDTLDVWLDSGSSWTMLESTPVDFYLEGSDQHRGWFQSSLLTHVAVTGQPQAPFKRLITHGFVLDENRQKMSKSLGNTVEPGQLIKSLGIDGLRLLIAQSDYTSDISLSPTTTSQVASMVKKFRLTFKYLLGNLDSYDTPKDSSVPQDLSVLDRHALNKINELILECRQAYDEQNFQHVVKLVQVHMNSELSSLYFDAVKDILYADPGTSTRRTAVQYVLYEALNAYVRLMSPIIPLLTQEVWDLCPATLTRGLESPLMAGYPEPSHFKDEKASGQVCEMNQVRELVNDAIEQARANKSVGSSLACDIYVQTPVSLDRQLLELVCIASNLKINEKVPTNTRWIYTCESNGTRVSIVPPSHHKCPRCWKFTTPKENELCGRCANAV